VPGARLFSRSLLLRITGRYLILGIAWILFSDQLLALLARDPEQMTLLQSYKGLAFVLLTALLLFMLIMRFRKHEEEQIAALRDRDERLHLAHTVTGIGVWEWDLKSQQTIWSPEVEALYGLSPGSFAGSYEAWLRQIHPNDRAKVEAAVKEWFANPGSFNIEYRIEHPSGEPRWLLSYGNTTYDDEGKPQRLLGINMDITRRKRSEEQLRESENRFRILYEKNPIGITLNAPDGSLIEANLAMQRFLGYAEKELYGHAFVEWTHPDDVAPSRKLVERLLSGEADQLSMEKRYRRKDGEVVWAHTCVLAVRDEHGEVEYFIATVQDITGRKSAEEHLQQAAAVFQCSRDGIVITDPRADIVAVNPAFSALSGYSEAEAIGKNLSILKSGHHDRTFYRQMWAAILKHDGWSGEIWNRSKNGNIFPAWLSISTVRDGIGAVINYVGVLSDLSRLKRSEDELEYMANHDTLTDLPNRRLLDARLEHAIDQARRHGYRIGVMLLDLDRFKDINDSLGLTAGDTLLQETAQRVSNSVRKEDTVARLGGDELLVVLEDILDPHMAARLAEKILSVLGAPFVLNGQDIFLTASIGISLYPDNGDTPELLIRNADAALYRAKEQGRNRIEFYSESISHSALERLALQAGLRHALANNELELHYQPQLHLASRQLAGIEALVRWRHPQQGLIPPDSFIPLAEQTGLIEAIGEWVLEEACRQMAAWRDAGLTIPRVAVNLSAHQLGRPSLIPAISGTLEKHKLPAQMLELELTETAIMRNPEKAAEILDALADLGIALAVDDFGTGYSSLAYLQRLRLHRLKIDRAFVQDLPQNQNNAAICRAIIAMATSLGLETVAEGVEDEAQREFLTRESCTIGQGWLFARGMPAAELENWLQQNLPD
jgi:diguanylate cyclase (GGDEF)-like protein/PAS domain S-box-containing protein